MSSTIRDRRAATNWQRKHDANAPKDGELAPGFALTDLSGEVTHRLSDYLGEKPVVLIFGSFT